MSDDQIDDTAVWNSLCSSQLKQFVENLPEGIETQIGEGGIRLSGGQRQRIGVARALYRNPNILIFDEATSALDNETEKEISNAIHNLGGKKTIIIIAHRLSTVRECDELVFMKNGMVAGRGDFAMLLDQNPDFRRMVLAAESSGAINQDTLKKQSYTN